MSEVSGPSPASPELRVGVESCAAGPVASLAPLPSYAVQMMLASGVGEWAPTVDAHALVDSVRAILALRLGQDLAVEVDGDIATRLSFAFPSLRPADDKPIPEIHLQPIAGPTPIDLLAPSLSQTFDWPDAHDVVTRTRSRIAIADAFAAVLPRDQRVWLLMAVIGAVAKAVPVLAVNWIPTQRIVEPTRLLEDIDAGEPLMGGAVNVRLFHVEPDDGPGSGSDARARMPDPLGEIVMDTLGLTAFGLPDLQVHARGLQPEQVAALLFTYAEHLFQHGDMSDDDRVAGIEPGSEWPVRHELSLAAPRRVVLDLHAGANALGSREDGP